MQESSAEIVDVEDETPIEILVVCEQVEQERRQRSGDEVLRNPSIS
ncbi:MAG: hypothetical protein ACKO70_01275 [Actinomycetota bacterium]